MRKLLAAAAIVTALSSPAQAQYFWGSGSGWGRGGFPCANCGMRGFGPGGGNYSQWTAATNGFGMGNLGYGGIPSGLGGGMGGVLGEALAGPGWRGNPGNTSMWSGGIGGAGMAINGMVGRPPSPPGGYGYGPRYGYGGYGPGPGYAGAYGYGAGYGYGGVRRPYYNAAPRPVMPVAVPTVQAIPVARPANVLPGCYRAMVVDAYGRRLFQTVCN